jgi:beta-N-acetylhexosaminidase
VKRLITFCILLTIIAAQAFSFSAAEASSPAQISPEVQKAQDLLDKMLPEERVGQLFLVTYTGSDTGDQSAITSLIQNQHIGGVVLRADNGNFAVTDGLPGAVQASINELQTVNWKSTISGLQNSTGEVQTQGNYIPLFIGISQEGDLSPYDQLINGMTPLPSEMAIGATWKPSNAEAVGKILGSELSILGFNLLLGPSLDVLDLVRTDVGDDLGVRTFGGDPYWVGQMGKAYISGIHEGSENKLLVISKHFPGRGGSDRLPEDEVATVRKSLEQLKQIELYPFFAVTKIDDDPLEVTDGLLLSHIRYQGFQGNIRATTRPVSFDETALDQIMALEQFADWREQGGLIVSDDLGSAAVQKFFAPTGTNFDARQVAKSALLAGNDLLYLGNIRSTSDDSSYTTVVKTHEYFVQKYKEDPVFQQRVDEAVLRILTLKFRLYPFFSLGSVTTSTAELDQVGKSQQVTLDIARQAVTLVSPSAQDLNADLPNAPQSDEQLVFISDIAQQSQCAECTDQSIFLAEDLRDAVIRLYGPGAGDLIQSNRLSAFSFDMLKNYLDGVDNELDIGSHLDQADWIIIAFSDFRVNSVEASTFQRLFSEKPGLVQKKKVIGFAFNAPYYPDATDISKFTAYYALYSKTPQFVEIAARTLFKEIQPSGALPVSVSSIGYDLIEATTPEPSQVIPLMVISDAEGQSENSISTSSNNAIVINAGDSLPIQTGIIKDHNGNPVPDGTVVRFIIDAQSASGTIEQMESQTVDGIARTVYRIPAEGTVKLSVTADPATISQILQIEITNTGGTLTSINPTFAPTGSVIAQLPSQAASTEQTETLKRHAMGQPALIDWICATIGVGLVFLGFYQYGQRRRKAAWNPWLPLGSAFGGYLFYLLPILGVGFLRQGVQDYGTWVMIGLVGLGAILGAGIGLLVRLIVKKRKTAI